RVAEAPGIAGPEEPPEEAADEIPIAGAQGDAALGPPDGELGLAELVEGVGEGHAPAGARPDDADGPLEGHGGGAVGVPGRRVGEGRHAPRAPRVPLRRALGGGAGALALPGGEVPV